MILAFPELLLLIIIIIIIIIISISIVIIIIIIIIVIIIIIISYWMYNLCNVLMILRSSHIDELDVRFLTVVRLCDLGHEIVF